MADSHLSEMLRVNIAQKRYYEVASGTQPHAANSITTNLWRRLRGRALGVFKGTTRAQSITDLHRRWIGDVSGLRVLELGVGAGSGLSRELATTAREYVAIDLSGNRIERLRARLPDRPGIRLYAADFLSTDFVEDGFDVIYALAVCHHFKHLDAFLDVVEAKLAQGGRLVTYDPAKVWWGMRLIRLVFRPFQTDAAWEHPFDNRSLQTLANRFELLDCQGVLGKSKWACVVGLLWPAAGRRYAQKWHDDDLQAKRSPDALRACLQVSYHLKKRPEHALSNLPGMH
jgi:SAM-dependent methyltransferase